MSKKSRHNKKTPTASALEPEKKVGYGDKKLEGPNRPAE
jgi:hypothetical protein